MPKKEPCKETVEILLDKKAALLENWFNAVDRLAFCIAKGYVPERDWKAEYRDYMAELIRKNPTYFQAGTATSICSICRTSGKGAVRNFATSLCIERISIPIRRTSRLARRSGSNYSRFPCLRPGQVV